MAGVLENIPVVTTYTTLRSELGLEAKDIDMFIIRYTVMIINVVKLILRG